MSKLHDQVYEFHQAMGLSSATEPTIIADDRVRLRAALIAEEFFETMESMFSCSFSEAHEETQRKIRESSANVDMVALADGLADLDYVVEGTRLEFGIDGGPIANEVHRANMAKVGGPKSSTGKQLKPEGWAPPDIARALKEQGWRP